MLIKRRINAGHVYLGRSVLEAPRIRDGDEVYIEVRGDVVIIKPVGGVDKDTLELIKMLEETRAYGGHVDYFEEYDYGDLGG